MHYLKQLTTSKTFVNVLLFICSTIVGILLYLGFLVNILPRFFTNMESIDKNILALAIVIFSVYILSKVALNLDTKNDRYVLLAIYILVLIIGLLRPDHSYSANRSSIGLNPLGFISDIQNNTSSIIVLFINLVIFCPMYFLLSYSNIFNRSIYNILFFEFFGVLIEFLQYKLGVGVCDLSDVILYNLSFFIGYIISLPFLNSLKKRTNKQSKKGSFREEI